MTKNIGEKQSKLIIVYKNPVPVVSANQERNRTT